MHTMVPGVAAIALYLFVAIQSSRRIALTGGTVSFRTMTGGLALLALVGHAVTLYPMTVTNSGINLGIFSAASLVAWLIAGLTVVATSRRALASLLVVIFPFAAIALGTSLLFSHPHVLPRYSTGTALHVGLSLVAYAMFAVAALLGLYLAFAERRLKSHHPVMRFLPPLSDMEQTMFQLTAIAFLTLSSGLLLGFISIDDISGQHLAHKIVFSILAWITFAVLLAGRHLWHWRGRRAVHLVLGGFVLLALGFFGSKVALELILERA